MCYVKNKNIDTTTYTENHHICPKADDMFPEYTDFNVHTWNSINLTAIQHTYAHIILWKAFGGSQTRAIHYFLNVQNSDYIKQSNRVIPLSVRVRYSAKAKEAARVDRLGMAAYKDKNGNSYFLHKDDPTINELGLVGFQKDTVQTELHKQRHSDAKRPNKVVTIYFLDIEIRVKLFSENFVHHIEQGWSTYRTKDDYDYINKNANKKLSEFWTNRNRYATPDGVFYGVFLKDDPIIKELSLISYRTQAQIGQNASRTPLATQAKLGTNIYNNGIEEKFLLEPIDETWVLGRLPRNDEWEATRKKNMLAKVVGSKIYTNGITNMYIKENDPIPEGFYLGMKFRPNTTYTYTNDTRTELKEFVGYHTPPENMKRITGKEKIDPIKKSLGLI